MVGHTARDELVAGLPFGPAMIAGHGCCDAFDMAEDRLNAPETAAREHGGLEPAPLLGHPLGGRCRHGIFGGMRHLLAGGRGDGKRSSKGGAHPH